MTKQTANVSFTNLLVIWVFFIAFSGGYSIYLIVSNLSGTAATSIPVIPVVKPVKRWQTDNEAGKGNRFVSKAEFEKISRFRTYLDSLTRSPTGKKIHDSIAYNRPGLLDSLTVVENYYQSNFKNYYHGKKN